jgi:NADPH:quinone reductase
MNKAIVIEQTGSPEVMVLAEHKLPALQAGQARVRHTAIGFNMIDTYMRKGLYPVPLPMVPGVEAAGVVEAVADDVTNVSVGDRVVYMTRQPGCYAEQRLVDSPLLIVLPDGISDEVAAASFLKGLTAWAFLTRTYAVKPGDSILIYAAAGGLGSLMCQWGKALGARVIGVVGSREKVQRAKACGCDAVIVRGEEAIAPRVRELTGDKGVQVVYDSLGQATFDTSLDCIAPLGTMVSLGNATGPVEPFNILTLAQKGSLSLVRPQVYAYVDTPEQLQRGASELFRMISSGAITVDVTVRYPLAQAAEVHRLVESGVTVGSSVLLP